jgi:hypothetical protein
MQSNKNQLKAKLHKATSAFVSTPVALIAGAALTMSVAQALAGRAYAPPGRRIRGSIPGRRIKPRTPGRRVAPRIPGAYTRPRTPGRRIHPVQPGLRLPHPGPNFGK